MFPTTLKAHESNNPKLLICRNLAGGLRESQVHAVVVLLELMVIRLVIDAAS